MRRPLLAGAAAVAAVAAILAALLVAPLFTDWTARRDQLAEIASDRIGRPVALHGPVRLRLLPSPIVEAEGVTLGAQGGVPGGTDLSFSASALRLRLDGAALLLGRIVPREVALVGAELRVPWPPAGAAPPPAGLPALSAELVDSRLVIGGVRLENVQARLTAGDAAQALRASGRFAWNGLAWRFEAGLGRAGPDGVTPVELTASVGDAAVAARGVLTADGAVEGTVEASGPDLSLLVPGPPGPFRARGRMSVTAELLAADDLILDVGGSPARGALTLRLSPVPRLDAALVAGRVELDPWVAALRGRAAGLPLGLDLSAEAATFRGVPLRRLRAAAFREGVAESGRLTLSDVSAILPGGTEVELDGATAGNRLEAALRFSGTDLRGTIDAIAPGLGLSTDWLAPARFREGAGRARLVVEPGSVALPELSATLDGARVSGAGVLRFGARPALGLGLTLDLLDLEGWLRPGLDWPAASRLLGGIDANLRLAAERARWRGAVLERASLDAALEGGRLTLRRLTGGLAGAEVTASGTAMLGASPRLSDATLEMSAAAAQPLAALIGLGGSALAREALTLRATASGAPEALAVTAGAELGEARAEAAGTVDLPGRRGGGTLTLRHPGAPRFLAGATGADWPGRWTGEGSLSLVAALAAGPQGVLAERFDLVAGGLRAGGQLGLLLDGPRPRLRGRIAAETLLVPPLPDRGRTLLPVAALRGVDAELALLVARLETPGLPALRDLRGRLRLLAGALALEEVEARTEGGAGALRGGMTLDASGDTPRLGLSAAVRGAEVTGPLLAPLLALPLDVASGEAEADLRLEAAGSGLAALLDTLGGEAALRVRGGAIEGIDAAAAGRAAAAGDEAALRRALREGRTEFETHSLRAALAGGRAALTEGVASGEGVALLLRGEVDLARAALDLIATQAPGDPVPPVGVRLTGPSGGVRRVPDLSAWLRWRAER